MKKFNNGKKLITGLILLMFISTLLVGCGAKRSTAGRTDGIGCGKFERCHGRG